MNNTPPVSAFEYYASTSSGKSAITLVTHGLNVKPIAMLSLISWLTGQGSDVYLVRLSGHRDDAIPLQDVTALIWQQEMQVAYSASKKAATDSGLPLFFLGYSLGALLGQSMILLREEMSSFHKQVLIAPAIALRRRTHLIRALFFLGKRRTLPSFTPALYRANTSLPLRIYEILFAEATKVQQSGFTGLHIPTLIIIDPKDEFISFKKLVRFIKRFQLTHYQVFTIHKNNKDCTEKYHHLILDEKTMGRHNWGMVLDQLYGFLFGNKDR